MSDYGSTPPPPPPPPPPPSYGAPGAQGTPPPNYLIWAILTVLLCWPLAIPAIIFSTQVNSKWALGDVSGAQDASVKAKRFAMWATIAGAILIVIWVSFFVIAAMTAGTSTGY